MSGPVVGSLRRALTTIAFVLAASGAAAQEAAFVHVATAANTADYVTYLDDPLLNGRPGAVFFVTPVYKGVYNPHHIALYYYAAFSSWIIENQDLADIPLGSAFNVWIPTPAALAPSQPVFVHTVTAGNTSGGIYTMLDHWWINGNPNTKVHVTPVRVSSYVPWQVILEYDSGSGRWYALPPSATFNWTNGTELHVCADDFCIGAGLLAASAAWTTDNTNTFQDESYSFVGDSRQTVLASRLLTTDLSENFDHPGMVWLTPSPSFRWAIISQDGSTIPFTVPLRTWYTRVIYRNRFETGTLLGW